MKKKDNQFYREPRFPYDPSFIGTPGCVNLARSTLHLFSQRIFSKKSYTTIYIRLLGTLASEASTRNGRRSWYIFSTIDPIQIFDIGLHVKDSLGKRVKCGTSQVYTTRHTKKGGVIGEPWFPIPIKLIINGYNIYGKIQSLKLPRNVYNNIIIYIFTIEEYYTNHEQPHHHVTKPHWDPNPFR